MVGFGQVRMALCMLAGLWRVPVVTESNDYLEYLVLLVDYTVQYS